MSEVGNELVRAARHELGKPFEHHYKPVNLCEGGRTTVEDCMERGLGVKGYDCSGLVITSLCRVLDIGIEEWPREYRHSFQLNPFGESRDPEFGDILLIDSKADDGYQYNTHIGLHIASRHVIHANGKTRVVDEGEVMGNITGIKPVDMSALTSALAAHIKSLK